MSNESNQPYGAPPPGPSPFTPPPPLPPAGPTQLVRDPYTSLGGVASGIAHHYGIDVSLVRILFVVFTLTTGFGILIYLLAWLIVPRAEHWPPVGGPAMVQSVSSRKLGLGLAVVGVLIALFLTGDGVSQILVPLLLISGGVWLLSQAPGSSSRSVADTVQPDGVGGTVPGGTIPDPRPPVHPSATATGPASTSVPPTGSGAGGVGGPDSSGLDDRDPTAQKPPPDRSRTSHAPGTPVPARNRRLRPRTVLIVFGILMVPFLIGTVGLIAFATVGREPGVTETVVPLEPADIPPIIEHTAGNIVLDLSNLDPESFEGRSLPIPVELQMDLGTIQVVVPEELPVEVDAAADVGEVRVFGQFNDGFEPTATYRADDPLLNLDIDVDLGLVEVTRP